jgi:RimJ/RimL family protein N-acetyltransferase
LEKEVRMNQQSPYPADLEKPVVLPDGGEVLIRPIRPDDVDRLEALFYRLSPTSIYFRFHAPLREMPRRELERYCSVDYQDTMALVAQVEEDDGPALVGVSRYARLPNSDLAEAAVVVEDAWQRRGIGRELLVTLTEIATQQGIQGFTAAVLAENTAIRRIYTESGYEYTSHWDDGVLQMTVHFRPA